MPGVVSGGSVRRALLERSIKIRRRSVKYVLKDWNNIPSCQMKFCRSEVCTWCAARLCSRTGMLVYKLVRGVEGVGLCCETCFGNVN